MARRRLFEKYFSWIMAFVAMLAISIIASTGVSAGGGVGTLTVTITPHSNLVVHEVRVVAEGEDITIKEVKVQLDQNPLTGVRLWEGGKVIGSAFASSGLTVTFFVNLTVPKDTAKALAVTTEDASGPLKLKSVDVVAVGVATASVITASASVITAEGQCGERFYYEAFLQSVIVIPGEGPVFFRPCPALTMPVTFTGKDIRELSWTEIHVEGKGLVPAMAGTIRDGIGSINFGQQIIPDLIVSVSPTTDPTLQSLLTSAFAERSTQTVFVGTVTYGGLPDGAGGMQIFVIWIDIQDVDIHIPPRIGSITVDPTALAISSGSGVWR